MAIQYSGSAQTSTFTPTTKQDIICPQCGREVAIRENLAQNNRALMIHCPSCKLGLIMDTTADTTEVS